MCGKLIIETNGLRRNSRSSHLIKLTESLQFNLTIVFCLGATRGVKKFMWAIQRSLQHLLLVLVRGKELLVVAFKRFQKVGKVTYTSHYCVLKYCSEMHMQVKGR